MRGSTDTDDSFSSCCFSEASAKLSSPIKQIGNFMRLFRGQTGLPLKSLHHSWNRRTPCCWTTFLTPSRDWDLAHIRIVIFFNRRQLRSLARLHGSDDTRRDDDH